MNWGGFVGFFFDKNLLIVNTYTTCSPEGKSEFWDYQLAEVFCCQ